MAGDGLSGKGHTGKGGRYEKKQKESRPTEQSAEDDYEYEEYDSGDKDVEFDARPKVKDTMKESVINDTNEAVEVWWRQLLGDPLDEIVALGPHNVTTRKYP